MATCSRCGNPILFRYVDGRCVPIHTAGGCIDSAWSHTQDYSGYSRSEESNCFLTNCPECGREVFFVRYNGGSVWIDPPLGPPWEKHPCMDQEKVKGQRSNLVLSAYKFQKEVPQDSVLAVVKEAETSWSIQSTLIKLITEADQTFVLLMKHNAGFLTGQLVRYEPSQSRISVFGDPSKVFLVVAEVDPINMRQQTTKTVVCPECDSRVRRERLRSHLGGHFWSGRIL